MTAKSIDTHLLWRIDYLDTDLIEWTDYKINWIQIKLRTIT